jgi:hypothetical protein
VLRDRVVDLRTHYLAQDNNRGGDDSPQPGHLAHCGIWFPPVDPVGAG